MEIEKLQVAGMLQQSEVSQPRAITLTDNTLKGGLNSTVPTTLFAPLHLFSLRLIEARDSKSGKCLAFPCSTDGLQGAEPAHAPSLPAPLLRTNWMPTKR